MKKILLIFLILAFCALRGRTLSAMDHAVGHEMMHGMYGRYSMNREASGTSWVPDSSPPEGFSLMHKGWVLMFNGFSYYVADVQRGKRGGSRLLNENMFMFMAQKDFDKATLAFRTMFSIERLTIGKCGYPLLLQTGEACNGRIPLIDKQHPHDLFGELAMVGTYTPTPETSLFLYAALPGEPALGPPVYFMRFSAEYIPETPLGHHWMDSTHISFGVLTAGLVHKNYKLEASVFNGREPNQNRFDIERPKLDSYSFRVSLNPAENIALQASYGFLKRPEQLDPEMNTKRIAGSVIYNRRFRENSIVQGAVIFGVNRNKPGNTLPAFLIEATAELHQRHLPFARFEIVKKDDLFIEPSPLARQIFTVKKLTVGYVYEFLTAHHLKWGIGGLIDFPMVPDSIKNYYGKITSFMIFLQVRLV